MKNVQDVRNFLKENGRNCQIIYLLNDQDEEYYMITDMRVDSEGDVVFDISL